jgi:hypothetical protein
MAHDIDTVLGWRGETVLDSDGDKIGTLKELYLDRDDRPAWGAVHTGLFGLRQTFVPLAEVRPVDGGLQLPYAKEHVKDAPSVDPDSQLSDEEESRLYRHYELSGDEDDEPRERGAAEAAPREAEAPPREAKTEADDAPREAEARPAEAADGDDGAEMIRSEEELVVGTRKRPHAKARLRKYVVTEHVQRTVPVQREEVRVEYEPAEGEEPAETADDVSRNRAD